MLNNSMEEILKEKLNIKENSFKREESKKEKVSYSDITRAFDKYGREAREFILKLDVALEILIFRSKNKFIEDDLREDLNRFISDIQLDRERIRLIAEYGVRVKCTLSILRRVSIEKYDKKMFIERQLISSLCKYISSFSKYRNLKEVKEKILNIFKALKVDVKGAEIERSINNFYDYNGEVYNYEILEKFREEIFEIVMVLAARLKELNGAEVDLNELFKIEEEDLTLLKTEEESLVEDIKEKKATFEGKVAQSEELVKEPVTLDNESENKLEKDGEREKINDVAVTEDKELIRVKESFKKSLHCKERELEDLKKRLEVLEINEFILREENERLKAEVKILNQERLDNMEYSANQYKQAIDDILKALNNESYGLILDKLYKFNKGYIMELNSKAISVNILRALEEVGVRAIEREKIDSALELNEKNIYNYRVNKEIDSLDAVEAVIAGPAWFYKREKLINQLLDIKEC